jgi:hypothetical protein
LWKSISDFSDPDHFFGQEKIADRDGKIAGMATLDIHRAN